MNNLIGQKFNELIPIKYVGRNKWGNALWLCRCDCGKEKIILGSDIKRGRSKNCGCSKLKHGHTKNRKQSKTYKSWDSMIQRCTNKNTENYEYYGGRGITICDRWLEPDGQGFLNFLEDMGEKPEGKSLDRVDNNLLIEGYSPNNCCWSTRKEQANNRRNDLIITFDNRTQHLIDWANEFCIPYDTLWKRIYRSCWSIEKAFNTPVIKRRK